MIKAQHLAIIFIIIILPISLVLSNYIQSQIDTITLQTQYNSRLYESTYDAVQAFQINTVNNRYSSISDSKIRDIEASVNTFYNYHTKNIFHLHLYFQDHNKLFYHHILYIDNFHFLHLHLLE